MNISPHKTDWTLLCGLLIALVPAFFQAEARQVRVATYNVLSGVGAVGSAEYLAVRDTLQRIDADVIAFQELRTSDRPNWQTPHITCPLIPLRLSDGFWHALFDHPETAPKRYIGRDDPAIRGMTDPDSTLQAWRAFYAQSKPTVQTEFPF